MNWDAFVKMAQTDMKSQDKPEVVKDCVRVFTQVLHWPDPGLPDIRMVSEQVCPDLRLPKVGGAEATQHRGNVVDEQDAGVTERAEEGGDEWQV